MLPYSVNSHPFMDVRRSLKRGVILIPWIQKAGAGANFSFLIPPMSYPYHGQYPDEYSTPSTPRDPFPQWEVLEQHQPQAQGAQMPQHQDIQLNQPSPLTPIQTTPLYAQHLQLDPEPYIPSQDSPLTEHPGGVLLHHVPQLSHHDR